MKLTFGGKLTNCDIKNQNGSHRALDVGTGTGIWAIEYGTYILNLCCQPLNFYVIGDCYPESIVS